MLAQVETVTQDGVPYLPVNALRRIVDSDMKRKFDLTGRLTLVLKAKQIELRLGISSAAVSGRLEPITLSHPPLVIDQQPMLPITFFEEVFPDLYGLEVAYNPELQRVRIMEVQDTPPISGGQEGFLVVVNPGHGGSDTGYQASDGVLEKEITLAVAKHVEAYCHQNGIRVMLTRDRDYDRRPTERVQLANQSGGQLFLSVHCNASYSVEAEGVHLYVNNSMWHRQSDDSTSSPDTLAHDRKITTLSQEDFLDRSLAFAAILQEQLKLSTGNLTPLTEIPLATLSEVYMPALLIELGYLSNAANQDMLTEFDGQEALAGSIGAAIVKYRAALKNEMNSNDGEQF